MDREFIITIVITSLLVISVVSIYQLAINSINRRVNKDKLNDLIEKWKMQKEYYNDLAEKYKDNQLQSYKYKHKALSVRDCIKDLYKYLENIN